MFVRYNFDSVNKFFAGIFCFCFFIAPIAKKSSKINTCRNLVPHCNYRRTAKTVLTLIHSLRMRTPHGKRHLQVEVENEIVLRRLVVLVCYIRQMYGVPSKSTFTDNSCYYDTSPSNKTITAGFPMLFRSAPLLLPGGCILLTHVRKTGMNQTTFFSYESVHGCSKTSVLFRNLALEI